MHEDFSREHVVKRSSERSFGLVMAAAFTVFALAPLRHRLPLRGWGLAVAGAFAVLAWIRPGLLRPLNAAWTRFGLLLNTVTSPILLGLVFFGGVLPTGALMRAFGHDPMRRKRIPGASSYWVVRTPSPQSSPSTTSTPSTMTRQF